MKTTFIRIGGFQDVRGEARGIPLARRLGSGNRPRTNLLAVLPLVVGASVGACSSEVGTDQTLVLPARATFPEVEAVIRANCGSLDCHGHVARNFRVYGLNGLRLAGVPDGEATSELELDGTFYSLAALEPEALDLVVKNVGAQADQLMLIKKGRGTVHHKGAEAMKAGGPADRCLLSWFTGVVDAVACKEGAMPKPPDWP